MPWPPTAPSSTFTTLASLLLLKHAEHRPASGPLHLLFLPLGCSCSKPSEDSFPSPLHASNLSSVEYGATPRVLQGGSYADSMRPTPSQKEGPALLPLLRALQGYPRYTVPQTKLHPAVVLSWGEGGGFAPRDTWQCLGTVLVVMLGSAVTCSGQRPGMIFHTYTGQPLCTPKSDQAQGINGAETGKLTHGKSSGLEASPSSLKTVPKFSSLHGVIRKQRHHSADKRPYRQSYAASGRVQM